MSQSHCLRYRPARGALARDIADALGARPEAVEITGVQQGTDGAWLTVQVFAPAVEKNWSRT